MKSLTQEQHEKLGGELAGIYSQTVGIKVALAGAYGPGEVLTRADELTRAVLRLRAVLDDQVSVDLPQLETAEQNALYFGRPELQ